MLWLRNITVEAHMVCQTSRVGPGKGQQADISPGAVGAVAYLDGASPEGQSVSHWAVGCNRQSVSSGFQFAMTWEP